VGTVKSLAAAGICIALIPASGAEQVVRIPEQIESYLQQKYSGWHKYQRADGDELSSYPDCHPNLISGDFNDDGNQDFAMLLERDDANSPGYPLRLLAFLGQDREEFLTVVLHEGGAVDILSLCLDRKGRENHEYMSNGLREFRNPADVVVLGVDEKGASCFWVDKDGRVKKFTCSD